MTEQMARIQSCNVHMFVNTTVTKNIAPTLKAVETGYNEHQSRYVEHRNNLAFPIRLHGYEVESVHLNFGNDDTGRKKIGLHFRVKPKPYAFEGENSGVSEEACAAVVRDLKMAVFQWSPVHWDDADPQAAAAKLLDYWLNNNSPKPVDSTRWTAEITVFLGRFAPHLHNHPVDTVTCVLPLGGPEK